MLARLLLLENKLQRNCRWRGGFTMQSIWNRVQKAAALQRQSLGSAFVLLQNCVAPHTPRHARPHRSCTRPKHHESRKGPKPAYQCACLCTSVLEQPCLSTCQDSSALQSLLWHHLLPLCCYWCTVWTAVEQRASSCFCFCKLPWDGGGSGWIALFLWSAFCISQTRSI